MIALDTNVLVRFPPNEVDASFEQVEGSTYSPETSIEQVEGSTRSPERSIEQVEGSTCSPERWSE